VFSSRTYVDWRVIAALILLFLVSLAAVTPRLYAADEIEYFAFLRSLWFDHDLSFDNEYRHFVDSGVAGPDFRGTFLDLSSETGLRLNFTTIGCAILWSPFYAAGDMAARVMNWLGWGTPVDGYSQPYVAAVCIGSAIYGFLALLLSLRVVGQLGLSGTGGGQGLFAQAVPVLAVWLGTPLLFYMYVAPPFAHAVSAFAVAAFVTVWLSVRRRWSARGVAGLAALAAVMAMVREQDLFLAVGPAVDFTWAACRVCLRGSRDRAAGDCRRFLVSALAGAAAFVLAYLPQAISYLVLNGHLGPSNLVGRKMSWTAPHALQVLVSPEHGFFFWTPLAVMACAGLVVLTRRPAEIRRIAICLWLMVAAQVYVTGSVESWTVAGAFGQRRFVALTVLLVAGISALEGVARSAASRAVLAAAIVLSIWWNVGLAVQFGSGLMDRQRLELGRNAYTTFVTLPKVAPGLLWRYAFDRSSFYKTREGIPR
jgi:hypothetical protein